MAHMMKMTKAASGHMFNHYGRSDNLEKSAYISRKNENIKAANTVLNYNLAYNDQPQRQLDFLHKRLSEIKVHNRKDVNVMVDWVVTLPQSLNEDNGKLFFKEAYNFLNKRYGKKNVISAYVHMDEVTPHMHYAFVPVVEDKKKGGYKLSAKECITRNDLQSFHKDLSDHMERVFDRDIGILNEATKEGNKSIAELKRGTAQKELQKIKKTVEVAKKKIEDLEKQLKGVKLNITQISYLQPQKTLTGAIKGITIEDIENLKKTAIIGTKAVAENNSLKNENLELRKKLGNLKVPSIKDKVKENKEKAKLIEKAEAFDRLPDDLKKQFLKKSKIHNLERLER